MFSNQLHSSSELLEVTAGGRQMSNPPQPRRRNARSGTEHALTTSLCLGSSVGAKPLLDKLSVNAMCSTETVFLQK